MENPKPKKIYDKQELGFYNIVKTILLSIPEELPNISFTEVLNNRMSKRNFAPLSLENLSTILFLAARVKSSEINTNGSLISHRPSPSAGAIHPIDIFVSSPNLFLNTLNYYNPFVHSLSEIRFDPKICEELRTHLSESFPNLGNACVLWFISNPLKTAAKYENTDSLIWRDIGCLAMTIQLTCGYLGLSSCISGTLGYPFITELFSPTHIQSGGAIIIG